jgi:hypothetical protein
MRPIDADAFKRQASIATVKLGLSAERMSKFLQLIDMQPTLPEDPFPRCSNCEHLKLVNEAPIYARCRKAKISFEHWQADTRAYWCPAHTPKELKPEEALPEVNRVLTWEELSEQDEDGNYKYPEVYIQIKDDFEPPYRSCVCRNNAGYPIKFYFGEGYLRVDKYEKTWRAWILPQQPTIKEDLDTNWLYDV